MNFSKVPLAKKLSSYSKLSLRSVQTTQLTTYGFHQANISYKTKLNLIKFLLIRLHLLARTQSHRHHVYLQSPLVAMKFKLKSLWLPMQTVLRLERLLKLMQSTKQVKPVQKKKRIKFFKYFLSQKTRRYRSLNQTRKNPSLLTQLARQV